ncbi:MAG TPA: response regulator [Polyangiaceae bacterium]
MSFAREAGASQYGWLCSGCGVRSSGRFSAAELSDIDRHQAQLFRQEQRERKSTRQIAVAPPARRGPVLVVEDDADIRESVCMFLEDEGFDTVSAGHGKAALDLLRAALDRLPKLILLDLMMPVMNGWEFYELVSHDEALASIPTIVMSAQEIDASLGSVTMLQKPLRLEQLLSKINEVCTP